MNISSPSSLGKPSGFSLLIVMVFVGVSLVLFGSVMYWVSTNSKITQRNNLFNQAESAAESADECALSPMIRDYIYQSLNAANNYYTNVPSQTNWPADYQFKFADLNGVNGQISVNIGQAATTLTPLGTQFANLKAYQQYATNTATATTGTNAQYAVSATVQEIISFASIPVFQYAIFYNLDLEINPGKQMTINGPVHSNNNIYTTGASSSDNLIYASIVEAAQQVILHRSTNDPQSSSVGNVVFLDTTNNPLNNADSLSMPIGTNNNPAAVEGILNLPPAGLNPPNAAAYSPTGMVYLYNAVDLIVSNSPANNTNFVFYENPNASPTVATVLPDATNIVATITTNVVHGVTTYSTTYTTNTFYSYVTNATFYDYRESDTVQAIQIDVAKLNGWLTNTTATGGAQYNTKNSSGSTSKGHTINSIYAYNSVPLSSTALPAVRMVNGQQLPPAGLTVATPQPVYVKGNYNITTDGIHFAQTLGSTTNGYTVPAALMGDSVTILSANWSDAYNSSTLESDRDPVSTAINAAALEGIVPSITDSSGTKHYSGGVENFLRLLEAWDDSGVTLTYNGSIVVMFPSQYATNFWNGNVYGVPKRQWGFDTTFSQSGKLPPLTPQAKKVVRLSWGFY